MLGTARILESEFKRVVIVDDDDLFRESLGLNPTSAVRQFVEG